VEKCGWNLQINSSDYLNFNNQSYISVIKNNLFYNQLANSIILYFSIYTLVQEMHLKQVKVKSMNRPHR